MRASGAQDATEPSAGAAAMRSDGGDAERKRRLPSETCAAVLVAELSTIRRATAAIARRSGLSDADAEELQSRVLFKLIEDDYAVIRKFQGRSTLKTYLTVVIHRVALDFRVSVWGKWRPTAAAKREGPLGVLMHRLVIREGLSFEQARTVIETTKGLALSGPVLERLRRAVAPGSRRHFSGDDALAAVIDQTAASDCRVVAAETAALAVRASAALAAALARLSTIERAMLTLRFRDGLEVSAIGRLLALDGKVLYRRFARLLKTMRTTLEQAGLRGSEVIAALGSESFGLAACLQGPTPSDSRRRVRRRG